MSARQKALHGVRWTSIGSIAGAALRFVQISVLTRLIPAQEFGAVVIVVAFSNIMQIIMDLGLSNAIIHYKDISQKHLSSLYWVNVIIGGIFSCFLAFGSGIIARYYNNELLYGLLINISPVFLFSAIGQQLKANAEKQFRFSILARIEILATTGNVLMSITLAYIGAGAYAIVWGMVVQTALITGMSWMWLTNGWRPELRINYKGLGKYVMFGIYSLFNSAITNIASQLDVLIGGHFLEQKAIGYYGVSKDLCLRITRVTNPAITRVGFPLMSELQHDMKAVARIYTRTVLSTCSVNFPIYVYFALFSGQLVEIIFGSAWIDAAYPMRLLAIWALLRSINNPVGSLVMALGKPSRELLWNVAVLVLLTFAILASVSGGTILLAKALIAIQAILIMPAWYFLIYSLARVNLMDYARAILLPLLISLSAAGFAYLTKALFTNSALYLFVGTVIYSMCYLLISFNLNKLWWSDMVRLFQIRHGLRN